MTDARDDPSLVEVIAAALDARQRTLHTALPGRVVSYDAAEQTASIDLLVELAVPKRSGGVAYDRVPTLHGVPVGHPRGGGFVLHFPLQVGDHVWVMFSERSMDEVTRSRQRSQPRDLRLHDLSHAYALPAASPAEGERLPNLPDDALVIGQESGEQIIVTASGVRIGRVGASEAMVLGDALASALETLADAIDMLNTALVVPTGVPDAAVKATMTTAIATFKVALSASLSTKHRVDE